MQHQVTTLPQKKRGRKREALLPLRPPPPPPPPLPSSAAGNKGIHNQKKRRRERKSNLFLPPSLSFLPSYLPFVMNKIVLLTHSVSSGSLLASSFFEEEQEEEKKKLALSSFFFLLQDRSDNWLRSGFFCRRERERCLQKNMGKWCEFFLQKCCTIWAFN